MNENKRIYGRKLWHTMPLKSFLKIRKNLHFNDMYAHIIESEIAGFDKSYEIRRVIYELDAKFLLAPIDDCLSVDKKTCASKTMHHIKNYMPKKHDKRLYKLYIYSGGK